MALARTSLLEVLASTARLVNTAHPSLKRPSLALQALTSPALSKLPALFVLPAKHAQSLLPAMLVPTSTLLRARALHRTAHQAMTAQVRLPWLASPDLSMMAQARAAPPALPPSTAQALRLRMEVNRPVQVEPTLLVEPFTAWSALLAQPAIMAPSPLAVAPANTRWQAPQPVKLTLKALNRAP